MDEQSRQQAIAGAVRAEMARARKRTGDLRQVLTLSGPTISGRVSGAYPFKLNELDKIAEYLCITTQGLLDSAVLGESLRDNRLDAIPAFPLPKPQDLWAQPHALARVESEHHGANYGAPLAISLVPGRRRDERPA